MKNDSFIRAFFIFKHFADVLVLSTTLLFRGVWNPRGAFHMHSADSVELALFGLQVRVISRQYTVVLLNIELCLLG